MRPRSADRLARLVSDWLGRAGRGRAVRRRLADAAAGSAHPDAARAAAGPVQPARRRCRGGVRAWDSQARDRAARRPARPRGVRARCCRTARPAAPGVAWCAPISGSRSASRSTRCWRATRCRRCSSTPRPIRHRGWAGTPGSLAAGRARRHQDDAAEAVFEAEIVEARARTRACEARRQSTGWGGGYVTDVGYLTSYYASSRRPICNAACLLGGVAGDRSRSRHESSSLSRTRLRHRASPPWSWPRATRPGG